jgi:hypothetical protein
MKYPVPAVCAVLISYARPNVESEVARYGTTPARPRTYASRGTSERSKVSLMVFYHKSTLMVYNQNEVCAYQITANATMAMNLVFGGWCL